MVHLSGGGAATSELNVAFLDIYNFYNLHLNHLIFLIHL